MFKVRFFESYVHSGLGMEMIRLDKEEKILVFVFICMKEAFDYCDNGSYSIFNDFNYLYQSFVC